MGACGNAAAPFVALLILLALSFSAAAAELPALTGRVVDNAGMIDAATKQELIAKLASFETKTSIQIVVATIDSLDGEAIEPYANRLFRAWGLGQAGDDNGALLLVARNDRKMRIEVGYGLEGTLTDLHSKLIIENVMVPAFRAGDLSGGIMRSVDQMIAVLQGDASQLPPPQNQDGPENEVDPFFAIFMSVWISIFIFGFASAFLAPVFGKKIGKNRYRWLGMEFQIGGGSSSGGGWSSGSSSSGWSGGSSSGGGFSGGGGSSGGGGASGSW